MNRLWFILAIVGLFFGYGCTQPEKDTSTPENYMKDGSAMEPDAELVKQKEAEAAGRSIGNRGGGTAPEKGGR